MGQKHSVWKSFLFALIGFVAFLATSIVAYAILLLLLFTVFQSLETVPSVINAVFSVLSSALALVVVYAVLTPIRKNQRTYALALKYVGAAIMLRYLKGFVYGIFYVNWGGIGTTVPLFGAGILAIILGYRIGKKAKQAELTQVTPDCPSTGDTGQKNIASDMDLDSSHSAFLESKPASDNFTLIAQNVATIFYIVFHSDFGEKITEKQKLYATALIDLYAYISNGTISVDEAARSVRYATTGYLVLFPYRNDHGFLDYDATSHVVNLAMQLEAMIFNSDTNLSRQEIVNAVVEKKAAIKNMVNQTLMQGEASPLYNDILPYVMQSLESEDFQSIVISCEDFAKE